eukprot:CCRYP_013490-RA/>CCRYP_013490-RA protein AED:0.00 eAED:0.00 QI:173/1/0.5/1/0/0/2/0/142
MIDGSAALTSRATSSESQKPGPAISMALSAHLMAKFKCVWMEEVYNSETGTSRLPEQETEPQGGPRLRQSIAPVLERGDVLVFVLGTVLLDVHLAGPLVIAVVVLAEEQLSEGHLLLPAGHFGHGPSGGTGKKVGLERGEVL